MGRWIAVAWWAVLVVVFFGAGPLFIVLGVRSLEHAKQINSNGVTTTATVLRNISGGTNPCVAADLSYTTAGGQTEQGTVTVNNCLTVGSIVRVVYDPSAVNVVQLATQRGSTSTGWSAVVAGVVLTVLIWGAAASSVKRKGWKGLPHP